MEWFPPVSKCHAKLTKSLNFLISCLNQPILLVDFSEVGTKILKLTLVKQRIVPPNCILVSLVWWIGASALLFPQNLVPLESQVFFGQVAIEVEPRPDTPYIGLFASDSFDNPKIEFVELPINRTFSASNWVHVSRSEKAGGAENFSSHFFLPASQRELERFRTHLPVLVIDCSEAPSPRDYKYQDCFWGLMIPKNENVFPGAFQSSGLGGIKRRGSSSRFDPKPPLRLELRDWKRKDQAEKLLDFPRASDWILSPPSQQDPSLMRNALMYALSRDCGQYAPRTAFVEVFLNSNDRLLDLRFDYLGVYSLTEKIQFYPGRVVLAPETLVESNNRIFPKSLIFKFDRPGPGEFGVKLKEFDCTVFLVDPGEEEASDSLVTHFQRHMNEFARVLEEPEDDSKAQNQKTYRNYIDAESWHTWRWLRELARDVDLYRASSYFHLLGTGPEAGLIKAGPVWDFDRSMNSLDSRDTDPKGWTSGPSWLPNPKNGESPWWALLLKDTHFRKEHCLHWQKLRRGPLQLKNIVQHLERFENELTRVNRPPEELVGVYATSPFQRDIRKWRGAGPRGGTLRSEVRMMESWISQRLSWLDRQVAELLKK